MEQSVRHIIHKLVVDVETNSKETGFAIKNDAVGFLSDRVVPRLEALFAELERRLRGRVLSIDELTVTVSADGKDPSSGDIDRLICKAVEKELRTQLPEQEALRTESDQVEDAKVVSAELRRLQAVFHFLRTGDRPWWIANNSALSEVLAPESLLAFAVHDLQELVSELAATGSPSFVKRLIRQLPRHVLLAWFARAFRLLNGSDAAFSDFSATALPGGMSAAAIEKWWSEALSILRTLKEKGIVPPQQWQYLVALMILRDASKTAVEQAVQFVGNLAGSHVSVQLEQFNKQLKEVLKSAAEAPADMFAEISDDPVEHEQQQLTPVENAGLILLHPFLKHFLTGLGLMSDNKLTDPVLVAHVLHYVATGKEHDWEHTLRFEKFICGIPTGHPIEREVDIPEAMKAEADNLLNAALSHWTGLKSSSPELLRLEFLQRQAKIITGDFPSVTLVFERKTHDILLDSLPWNLGIVKLSWRPDLLYVEW